MLKTKREASALAIAPIEASAWVLDQLGPGELGFLRVTPKPPCWISTVAQNGAELADTLQQTAIEVISHETQALREAVRVLHPKVPARKAVA